MVATLAACSASPLPSSPALSTPRPPRAPDWSEHPAPAAAARQLEVLLDLQRDPSGEVTSGSAADRADVREGERVKGGGAPMGFSSKEVTVIVDRDGKEKTVAFLPQGATVDGSSWVRDAKLPDAACVRR